MPAASSALNSAMAWCRLGKALPSMRDAMVFLRRSRSSGEAVIFSVALHLVMTLSTRKATISAPEGLGLRVKSLRASSISASLS
ncbi:hypothetical protein D3C72_1929410 [compost metagenome]